jgi:chromosome segregation ATPase
MLCCCSVVWLNTQQCSREPCLQELEDELAAMRQELAAAREVAVRASGTWDKFRKERDFHRMHHKRVAQEKNKLITDIKRLKVLSGMVVMLW